MRECIFNFGRRGSGKTISQTVDTLEVCMAGNSSVVVMAPEPEFPEMMFAQLVAAGLEKRIIFDLADPVRAGGRFVQTPQLQRSTHRDPLVRRNQNEMFLDHFLSHLFATRQIKYPFQWPYIYLYLHAAAGVIQGIPGVPARLMRALFRNGNPIGEWLLQHSEHREASQIFYDLAAQSRKRPDIFTEKAGAADRLSSVLDTVACSSHDGDSLDWKRVHREKLIVIYDLSGIPTIARTALGNTVITGSTNALRDLFDETGEPHEFLLSVDELGAEGWATPYLNRALQEDRKRGFRAFLTSQTPDDVPPELLPQLLALTSHKWHNLASGADLAATDICDQSFTSDETHFTRDREMSDGFEKISHRTHNRGKNVTKLPGHKRSESETHTDAEHVSFQPKKKIVVEPTYKTPQLKHAEIKAELSNLPVGQYLFKGLGGVSRRTTIMPPEPWLFGAEFLPSKGKTLYEVKLEQAVARVRSDLSLYREPTVWKIPDQSNNGEMISLPKSKPGPTPKVRMPKGGSGMLGS